jgi:hypothetical protein
VAAKEICRRAGGKWRYRENEDWALPILLRLVEKGQVEDDSAGHFRLIAVKTKEEKVKWVSPEIKKILEKSGKPFDLGKEEESS